MKNHWLDLSKDNDKYKHQLPQKTLNQMSTPFFTARIEDVVVKKFRTQSQDVQIKIQMNPKIAKYFGKGKGTSLWATALGIAHKNLVGCDALLFKDKNNNLYFVGIKRPPANVTVGVGINP